MHPDEWGAHRRPTNREQIMSKSNLLAAVSFIGLLATTAAYADSNTVNLNQTGNYNIVDAYQGYNTNGNTLSVTQTGNDYSRTAQEGSFNAINSNQTGAYNFLGAPSSYSVQGSPAVQLSDVNTYLTGSGLTIRDAAFSQSGDHNTLNNTQSGIAGLVQGTQQGSYNTINTNQVGFAAALTADQNGAGNSVASYQGDYEMAAIRQVGNGNLTSGSQTGATSLYGFNKVSIDQNGNGNQVYYSQSGGGFNVMTVAQTGSNNVSNMTQAGSHNVATVVQH